MMRCAIQEVPRECSKRVCRAEGKTKQAVPSCLMPRKRWNSGVSMISTSRDPSWISPCTASRINFPDMTWILSYTFAFTQAFLLVCSSLRGHRYSPDNGRCRFKPHYSISTVTFQQPLIETIKLGRRLYLH